MELTLGYSPCPNDTFVFYGLSHGRVAEDLHWQVRLADVETLNELARKGALDVSKISYHAFAHVTQEYLMLPGGGALGKGVGPLIVTRDKLTNLSGRTVATPGGLTTANLLLTLSQPEDIQLLAMRYDKIMPAVASGEVEAGLIIHESRFTYPKYGLHKYLDLGDWWETTTGHLLPLGGIMARRTLGERRLRRIDEAIRESLKYGYLHRRQAQAYIAEHAQEMSEEVRNRHIELYVNDYTRDLGEAGRAAVIELFRRAQERGLVPPVPQRLFL